MHQRYYVVASALSSYFGIGFNTIDEQLEIDLGHVEKEFDEDAQERMDLGNCMEEGCLNFFEKKLVIIIDERNSEYKYAVNGLLMCKRDGRTFIDGVETGVENKYSNSSSECFTDSFGYELQCQAYMMAWGLDQWILCGMWQGKPMYKLIKKNEEIQKDIETIVDAVVEIMMGLRDIDDYPWDVVEKYSKQKQLKVLNDDDLEEYDKELLNSVGKLKAQKKIIEDFLPQFGMGAEVFYIGDSTNKYLHRNTEALNKLHITLEHGKLPDIIAYSSEKNLLFLIEAYHTSNPMNVERVNSLKNLVADSGANVVYVTAFLNKEEGLNHLKEIAWETEVWVADEPEHMIHLNGCKFLEVYNS